jgi:hypothetical protein
MVFPSAMMFLLYLSYTDNNFLVDIGQRQIAPDRRDGERRPQPIGVVEQPLAIILANEVIDSETTTFSCATIGPSPSIGGITVRA